MRRRSVSCVGTGIPPGMQSFGRVSGPDDSQDVPDVGSEPEEGRGAAGKQDGLDTHV